MDIWNYAKNTASSFVDGLGGNLFTGVTWTVVDEVSQRVANPIVASVAPGGMAGSLVVNYWRNLLMLAKLSLLGR